MTDEEKKRAVKKDGLYIISASKTDSIKSFSNHKIVNKKGNRILKYAQ